MKRLCRLSMTVLITAMLASSAFGGDIHIGGAPPVPDPPPATEPGDIYIPGTSQGSGFAGPTATEVALNLLQELLLVF